MRYGATEALKRTDLAIEAGKTTALIGPSGCGKSTILRLIVGLITPTEGIIEFNDAPITDIQTARRKMGYVIQDGGLFPHLNAERNITMMWRHLGRDRMEGERRLTELCELTRFPGDGLHRFPVELSGGQRQRVSLMRALMLAPEALLLDEPLGALDPIVRASLQTELKRIFAELNKTVVLVTHDMAEAAYLGDTIVLLNEGRIAQQGSLEDLRERPAGPFVTEFINAQRSLVQL